MPEKSTLQEQFASLMVTRWHLPAALLFICFFCIYTTPLQDGDFFWHLRTGQWIWEHKMLPAGDPFSQVFTGPVPAAAEKIRIDFTLKQYWLGQLLLYGLWESAGSAGIILFRAFSYTGILVFLYWWMQKKSCGVLPYVFIILTGDLLSNFPSERPQLLTFLFTPLVLYLLEKVAANDNRPPVGYAFSLSLLMIIWANCHGGYLVGILLILIYLGATLFPSMAGKTTVPWQTLIALALPLAATIINPCGIKSLLTFLHSLPDAATTNLEFLPPWRAARDLGKYFPSYWSFLLLVVTLTVSRFRSLRPRHLAVMVFLALLSATALRNMPFPFFASPLLITAGRKRDWPFAWTIPVSLVATLLVTTDWRTTLSFRPDSLFPNNGVQFIRTSRPAPELFNYYDWGGYLMYYLPGYKVFIDGRGLYEQSSTEYDKILFSREWKQILDSRQINTVIMPGVSKSTGMTYPLVENLRWDTEWSLVFGDDITLIFVRNIAANQNIITRSALEKGQVYRHVLLLLDRLTVISGRVEYWISKGNAHSLLLDYPAARIAYQKALTIDPTNAWARQMLLQLQQ